MQVFIHSDPAAVAVAVAERIGEELSAAKQRFTLGLSGGTTPIATYEVLRDMRLDWSGVDAWVSDERWVPPDHQRSNGRMAEETLIRHVGTRFHRPGWSEMMDPEEAAAHYESVIRSVHRGHRPDVVHLGMGDDGHTASLFPDTDALHESDRWIVVNDVPAQGETRITATYPLLWNARTLLVQATGTGKAEAVKASMEGTTPAGRLGEGLAKVEWHLDTEAASLIS